MAGCRLEIIREVTPYVASALGDQLSFLVELEKLKLVQRRNLKVDGVRNENSAEHSWHVAIMAMVLREHSNRDVDLLKVLKMLLIHDVVEIYAGDSWLYGVTVDQGTREREAATKLFAMLPQAQGAQMLELWNEFEAGETEEACFAKGIDAFQPLLNHLVVSPACFDDSRPQLAEVLEKKQLIAKSSRSLWDVARRIAELSADRGLYRR